MQTDYNVEFEKAVAGMQYEAAGMPKKVSTYANAAEAIPYGRVVAKVPSEEIGVKLPTLLADQILGVSVRTVLNEDLDEYPIESAVAVMSRGLIWVLTDQAVTPDDPVYVRFATGAGGSIKGVVRKDADTATALLLDTAKFYSSAGAGEYVVLDINIP